MSSLHPHETRSVLEHISDLRKKILIIVGAVVVGTIGTHFFHEQVIAFLLRPAGSQQLIFLSPLDPLLLILKIDLVGGIVLAFPIIIWCTLSYVAPALPKQGRLMLILFCLTSVLLIIGGLLYAFLITIPLSLQFLFSIVIPGIQNQISAQNYISFFITQALIIVAIFQVPIVIIGGAYLNAFRVKFLADKRRYIYLIVVVGLAILTPTSDIFSLAIVLVPCLVIFEISLIGAKFVEYIQKRRRTLN